MEVNYYGCNDLALLTISSRRPVNPYWQRVMQWHCSTWFTPSASASQAFQCVTETYLIGASFSTFLRRLIDCRIFYQIHFAVECTFSINIECLCFECSFKYFMVKGCQTSTYFSHYCCHKINWCSLNPHADCLSFWGIGRKQIRRYWNLR